MNVPQIIVVIVPMAVAVRLWLRRRRDSDQSIENAKTNRSVLQVVFGDAGLVAGREIRERVRSRIFQVGTGIILLAVAAAIVIPVETKTKPYQPRVAVVGRSSIALRNALDTAGSSTRTTPTLVPEADESSARIDLHSGRVDVAIIDARQLVVDKPIADTDTSTEAQFIRVVSHTLGTTSAYDQAGLSTTQARLLARAQPLEITSLRQASSTDKNHTARGTSTAGLIVVFVMLSQYDTWILTGVVEEKTSRVVEVLLATVRPIQLLSGKVLGIGLVAFMQATIIAAFALGLAKVTGSDILHGTAPVALLSTFVWLVAGYSFYCWVYAAAGSTAQRQEQVQSLAFPLTLPLLVGYVVALAAVGSGNVSTFLEVLAYLPPTAPLAMPALVGLGGATWWQFSISVAISIVCTVLVAKLATTIYRRAILRTGHRVRLREVLGPGAQ